MLEILRVFDHETARSKNTSFRYFMKKYGTDGIVDTIITASLPNSTLGGHCERRNSR